MVETSTGNPYQIIDSEDNWEIRYFKNEDPRQLFWHRDKELRKCELLWGDIEFQNENQLPQKMYPGQSIYIPEERYHRVIANDSFAVKIYKY